MNPTPPASWKTHCNVNAVVSFQNATEFFKTNNNNNFLRTRNCRTASTCSRFHEKKEFQYKYGRAQVRRTYHPSITTFKPFSLACERARRRVIDQCSALLRYHCRLLVLVQSAAAVESFEKVQLLN